MERSESAQRHCLRSLGFFLVVDDDGHAGLQFPPLISVCRPLLAPVSTGTAQEATSRSTQTCLAAPGATLGACFFGQGGRGMRRETMLPDGPAALLGA